MSGEEKSSVPYPVSEQFKVLEGYDIYRSNKLIVALVVVESKFGDDLRMYRWQLRGESCKVDWAVLASKAKELLNKYKIKK